MLNSLYVLFNTSYKPEGGIILFYRGENWGAMHLNVTPKVTHLVTGRVWILTHVSFQSSGLGHWRPAVSAASVALQ